ncbi:MAG TPA: molybdopterin dinucleotide binding domain-containing protein [Longimicrobiales bacterium]|nr:molybdopterin dinucleotide binding domain-containing protein [Longimicrobiales bacterium]
MARDLGERVDGIRRRDFLKVVGVSGAGATLTGCSTGEVERLLPYVVAPEEVTPGVATWYTTVCGGCSAQCGMWVRTREGRAVKVEGNPAHPVSEGGLCSRGHATLQHLYNPDRFHGPMLREGPRLRQGTWDEAERLLAARIRRAGSAENAIDGGRVLFITGHTGPSMSALIDEFVAAVDGIRVDYDAVSDAPLREAARIAYGVDGLPRYDVAAARLLLSFGNDFIETGPSPVEHNKGLARMSAVNDEDHEKGRFVYLGPRLSLTGLNADEWIPIRSGSEAALALGMASAIAGPDAAGPYGNLLQTYDPASAAQAAGVSAEAIEELAERFVSEGPSLALGPGAGAHHRNATAANLAVMILNHVAGNVGRTVHYEPGTSAASSSFTGIEDAIGAMSSGEIGVVIVHGANPAYSLPTSSGFREAFEAVPYKVTLASAQDETAELSDLVMPDRHFLESWGDSAPRPGVMAIRQPVMEPVPMFDAKQAGDALLAVAGHLGADPGAATFYEYLRARHEAAHDAAMGDFETSWREALRAGVATHASAAVGEPQLQPPSTPLTFDAPALDGNGEFTLIVHPSSRFAGGEFSNSPWMQELPDPVSKITWHSWLEVNPHTAEERGLRNGDIVTVTSPHGSVEVPVWLYPGIREDAVALAMGGGHTAMGRYADGSGVNALDLLPSVAEQPSGALVTLATTVTVEPTGRGRPLVTIEGSDDQHDRPIAPAVQLALLGEAGEEAEGEHHEELQELQAGGGFIPVPAEEGVPEAFPLPGSRYGMYENAHEGPRWAMAIDLDKCTGCSACVTACQAENNVPWVGEQQVLMGRDMNWIRIERYYEHIDATQAGDLDVRFLPMMCQHCGNAPCEPVCPVFATYHTPEGVNAQIYNRCVGTRYCANNCPYKVRVFNWYRYTSEIPEPLNWQWNPDVTVRDNGVMEKCSFCMQRIRDAENRAALEGRRDVRDGEIVPACEQSCPAEAIVFGNIRDPNARVTQMVQSERTYRVLDELINTQPAVSYLKKVTFHEVAAGAHG